MKKIKKLIKNVKVLYHYSNKIKQVKKKLYYEFGNIKFVFASFGGADINYYILKDKKKFALLRLAIRDIEESTQHPILRFNKKKRLEKEYEAYSMGSKHNLTPKVLYRFDDGLVCEYIDGQRVFDVLRKDTAKVWLILEEAIQVYRKLHDLGITHLDATLKNFILDDKKMKVIDFEYYPSENLSLEMQKAYDYVRIIEHTLRVVPTKEQENYHNFLNVLDETVPNDIRNVEFTLVKPWLENIQTFPIYVELQKRIFTNLIF